MRSDCVVECGGQKETRIIAGLQIARSHLAAVLRPGFGDVGAGERPFASNAHTGDQTVQG